MDDYNINIFNKNFYCGNKKSILELYKTKNDIFLFNNKVIFHSEKYLHPLFLNYNYCLFCYNKRKTKYFSHNLTKIHNDDTNLFNYLENNNIKLKKVKNKKEKIVRRFIHSFDVETINYVNNNNKMKNNSFSGSDTELYIDKSILNKNNKKNNTKNDSKNLDNTKYNNNSPSNNQIIQKKFNSDLSKIDIPRNQNHNHTINSFDISSKDEKASNSMGIKIEEFNLKEKQPKRNRKKTFNYPSYPLKKLKSENIKNSIILCVEENKDNKNNSNNNISNTKIKKLNKSSDLLILSGDNINHTKGYISLFKNFALNQFNGFKKKTSKNINKKTNENIKDIRNGLNNNYELKNEKCSICLEEIEGKFTLICGDFFCRECITQLVKNCIKDISKFDKIYCPLCHEKIEENTLKKILTEEEFIFYQKTNIRIKGIQDKNLIVCPYPDCEGFAEKSSNNKNYIFCCQNNHTFCSKCQEVVDIKYLKEENKHKCTNKNDPNLKYLRSQKNIRKCPNCNCWVQKEKTGCNNMTCSNIWCKFEFCWICGRAYDETHYKNPLSMCFGLASADPEKDITRGKGIRFIRCIFIFVLIIFILLPILVILFSLIEMLIYVIAFVLDGSALQYIKLKSKYAHRLFYKIAILFYLFMAIALIPVGYMSLSVIIISIPFICLIKNAKKEDDFD